MLGIGTKEKAFWAENLAVEASRETARLAQEDQFRDGRDIEWYQKSQGVNIFSWESQLGEPLTVEVFTKRLKVLVPGLIFKVHAHEPSYCTFYVVTEVYQVKKICPAMYPIMPEFSMASPVYEERVPESIGASLGDSLDSTYQELASAEDIFRGWRTVLEYFLAAKLVAPELLERTFPTRNMRLPWAQKLGYRRNLSLFGRDS